MTLLYAASAYLTLGLILALVSVVVILKTPPPTTPQEVEAERHTQDLVRLLRPYTGDAWPLVVVAVVTLAWPWVAWRLAVAVVHHLWARPGRHRA